MMSNEQWYAVYTRPRWEKKTLDLLLKKKYHAYCPLNKIVRKWSDRYKTIFEPLFSSYVFIKTYEHELQEIKKIDGVRNIVYWLGKPAVIQQNEIDAIKSYLDKYENVKLLQSDIKLYDSVKISSGPLEKMYGEVIEIKNKSVKIYLPSLGFTMFAEVEKSNLEVISKPDLNSKSQISELKQAI